MDDELLDDEIAPKKSKLPLIAGFVVVFLLGGGAGFGATLALGGDEAEAAEGEEGAAEKVTAVSPPAIHDIGKTSVNLRGGSGSRILRLQVQIEVTEADMETMEVHQPLLRDAVIALASDYSYDDLEGLDGKMMLRDELFSRLNALPTGITITRVYFTEFLVQ